MTRSNPLCSMATASRASIAALDEQTVMSLGIQDGLGHLSGEGVIVDDQNTHDK